MPSKEASVLEFLNLMNPQSPAEGDEALEVNVIPLLDVPLATSVPSTTKDLPLSNFTVTPESIVNVTPDATETLPVTVYGLSATAHVSGEEIVPDADVPADRGEIETKARSRDRAITVRRSEPREPREPSVLTMEVL